MNEFQKKRKKMKKQPRSLSLIMIVGGFMLASSIGVMFGLYWTYNMKESSEIASPTLNSVSIELDVEGLIKEGDDAYRMYRYDYALHSYRMAEEKLLSNIEFENNSPSKNVSFLQHCYNTKSLLETRIKLVLIAEGISRLRQGP